MRGDKDQAGKSFLDQLSEIVNKGDNSDKEVTELDSPEVLLDSFLDFEGESEETRSSFGGESIFDRAEKKTFEGERIFVGDKTGPAAAPSSDKFLNSLISLLVEETNIEKDFSDYLDHQVDEHNGGRAVIELREEDYPDIFDTADTAGNFDGILNAISADSALVVGREGPVREKSFIEEEQEATQDDVEETANQLAGLLSDLEGVRRMIYILVVTKNFFLC